MNSFSVEEKKRRLEMAFWDLAVDADSLLRLLNGEIEDAGGLDRHGLYRRLLSTYDWYTLLKIIPHERLSQMLDDVVLDRLFPKDLKEKYRYARKLLRG
jgi:hypothetical protein